MSSSQAALSYHEPGIVTILILSSFLLLANAVNYAFDRLLYCGLIGQIAIGIAWGTPGANWLSEDVQNAVMQLGYIGLILLVFEGGLSTDLKMLKSNLALSSLVALLGISAPIGLSFALQGFMDSIMPVQAFAAGAALCSTSLGTTFTTLSTSGLNASRLGVVLSSAAMMDDVVGLVMSGIISSLGSSPDFSPVTVIRPVFVSVAFAVILPLVCLWVVKPLTKLFLLKSTNGKKSRVNEMLCTREAALIGYTLVLVALVAAASYAGTSNLFAAYLAGTIISWWNGLCADLKQTAMSNETGPCNSSDDAPEFSRKTASPNANDAKRPVGKTGRNGKERATSSSTSPDENQDGSEPSPQAADTQSTKSDENRLSGLRIFETYYSSALETILKPFFFASIGFSIPITRMFSGSVVWRGMVYTILMLIGKLVCGLCLVRFPAPVMPLHTLSRKAASVFTGCTAWALWVKRSTPAQADPGPSSSTADSAVPAAQERPASARKLSRLPKPMSLYPAALLGSAMVARGEIGFLISGIAESGGTFGATNDAQPSEIYLIVTWAILLCTLLGPISVGLMVRRVKRLQAEERSKGSGRQDPLGIWGIVSSS